MASELKNPFAPSAERGQCLQRTADMHVDLVADRVDDGGEIREVAVTAVHADDVVEAVDDATIDSTEMR